MTTIKQVPAGLLQALGLHKGDFMTVRDELSGSFIIEITSPAVQSGTQTETGHRQNALAKFATGAVVKQASTEQELDDARYEYLCAKHLK